MNKIQSQYLLPIIILLIVSGLSYLQYMPLLNTVLLTIFAYLVALLPTLLIRHKAIALCSWFVVLCLGLFIAIYKPTGFNYPLVWQTSELYVGGDAFSLFINISKGLGGYLVIVGLYSIFSYKKMPLYKSILTAFVAAFSILVIANIAFDVGWKPKIAYGLLYFMAVNLLISVMAEEAFFRLLVQSGVEKIFSYHRIAVYAAVIFSTLLFTVSHSTNIGPLFFLYLLCGLIYSLVYVITRRFEVSILLHFLVNISHFIFLEYPL